jgi:glyoxylase-like metal-dependent hydrolase (beta-lactamase superfamily II)
MRYSVRALHFAVQDVPGPQAFWMTAWNEWVRFNYYAFLVRGEGHTILFDCGIDDLDAWNAMNLSALGERGITRASRREGFLLAALAELGVSPEDVDTVAFTHFHGDHAANARLFPRARYLVSAEGWRRLEALSTAVPQMLPSPLFPSALISYIRDVLDERVVLAADGGTPIPGVEIRHVGGHTADSAAFVIPTAEGSVLIAGDTICLYKNLEADLPVGSNVDLRACFETMAWARGAADIVLPTHDPELLVRHPGGIVAS